MTGITKCFGETVANQEVGLDVGTGEILGLLGENGAGKSTLMNVLYGLVKADSGSIHIDGISVRITSPADALAQGIGMVHQHFMLIDAFTVVENVVLGAEPARRGMLDHARSRAAVVALSERFGLAVDPDRRVGQLGVAARQRVEILRALYRGARILILDEPTAVLTPQESQRLFEVLTGMAQEGMSIILISHKLHELLTVTSRITILRDGRVVRTVPTAHTNDSELAALMVGRQTALDVTVAPLQRSDQPRLTVRNLTDRDGRLAPVDLDLYGGEIVGLAGVDGSGQAVLTQLLSGLLPARQGAIHLDGRDISHGHPQSRMAAGLGYVPDERSDEGLVRGLTLFENAVLRRQRRPALRRGRLLSPPRMRAHARVIVDTSDVRPKHVDSLVASLSGGNQQKLLMGRELADDPSVLIASQPTRGVDIGASRAIHNRLMAARADGRAILLNSLDLDEITALSDRILVMFAGRIVGEIARADVTDERLGLLMTGAGGGTSETAAGQSA